MRLLIGAMTLAMLGFRFNGMLKNASQTSMIIIHAKIRLNQLGRAVRLNIEIFHRALGTCRHICFILLNSLHLPIGLGLHVFVSGIFGSTILDLLLFLL